MARSSGEEGQGGSASRADLTVEEQPFTWKDMNVRQKAKHVIANVTVEPLTLLYVVTSALTSLTTQNLNVEKACRVSLNYTTELCDAFSARDVSNETEQYYNEVSKTVADMLVWQSPLQNIVPILLVLFVGSWTDRRHRRKPFLLAPVAGDLLMTIGLLLCSLFFSLPLEVAGVIEAIFPAFSGGVTILIMSVFSYIADVSTVESRTFRIGMVAAAVYWASPIASALSGVAFTTLGFVGVYILGIVLHGSSLVYGIMYIREPHPPVPRPPGMSFVRDFCNWRHVWDTAKVALRKRVGSRQMRLLLVLVLQIAIQGPLQGESAVSFLYVTQRFRWDLIQVSAYATYSVIVGAVGTVLVTTVFTKWLELDDCVIGLIAMVTKVIAAPLYAFASTDWHLYAVTLTDILIAGGAISMRAIPTKLVEGDELGKLMALLAIAQAISPVIFNPVYSKVYSDTVASSPGAFFYITAGVSVIAVLIYIAIYMLQRKDLDVIAPSPAELEKKTDPSSVGVSNPAFQTDRLDEVRHRSNGVDNTFL